MVPPSLIACKHIEKRSATHVCESFDIYGVEMNCFQKINMLGNCVLSVHWGTNYEIANCENAKFVSLRNDSSYLGF